MDGYTTTAEKDGGESKLKVFMKGNGEGKEACKGHSKHKVCNYT